jgi:hypothetical protein
MMEIIKILLIQYKYKIKMLVCQNIGMDYNIIVWLVDLIDGHIK